MRAPGDPDFAVNTYQHAKSLWRGTTVRTKNARKSSGTSGTSSPFSNGRDPKPLADVLSLAAEDMGWGVELEQARLISDWAELVGPIVAPHTTVVELRDGLLMVQCDSTAWATELRRIRAEVLTVITQGYAEAGVEDLRFLAPGAPTWRHGARVVRGRGPRDTYG